jgi:hypothetical protein
MRWHSYQPLHGRARLNRNGGAQPSLPAVRGSGSGVQRFEHDYEQEHEQE